MMKQQEKINRSDNPLDSDLLKAVKKLMVFVKIPYGKRSKSQKLSVFA